MSEYAVARLDEIEEVTDGREPWRPVRHHFGITSFGVNTWTGRNAGDRIINEHDEAGEDEELYLVQQRPRDLRARRRAGGRARRDVRLRGARREADGVRGGARHDDRRDRRAPREGLRASGWELWGRCPRSTRRASTPRPPTARGLVEAHPEYPLLAYNLACCESLAGRTADAIEHLRLAIEGSERVREFAAGDSDFDPIREEPAFKELLAGASRERETRG